MKPAEYLRLLRRRWWVLPIAALLGVGVAYVTRPGPPFYFPGAGNATFQAKHVMVSPPIASAVNPDVDYDRLALLATTGEGPQNVADTLALGTPASAVQRDPPLPKDVAEEKGRIRGTQLPGVYIIAAPSSITGSLTINATAKNERLAIAAANAAASELTILINQPSSATAALDPLGPDAQLQTVLRQRDRLLHEIHGVGKTTAGALIREQILFTERFRRLNAVEYAPYVTFFERSPEMQDLLQRRSTLSSQIADLDKKALTLIHANPRDGVIVTLSPASAETTSAAFVGPPKAPLFASSSSRIALGAGIGALVGVLLLLLWEVLRPRIRDVRSAEGAAQMPLVAEIPRVKLVGDAQWRRVVVAEEPAAPLAEAYRGARTSLVAMWPRLPANVNGNARYNGSGPPLRSLLITSGGPNEGKSTSVVNLATAFAETGRSVIVLDADFLRPTLHQYFHRAERPNLGALNPTPGTAGLELRHILQDTGIPGVRFAAAPPLSPPAQVLTSMRAALAQAIELADIVILDSPPLLAASTAADLATEVDATLLVVRSDVARRRSTVAAAEYLRRIEAKVIGVVLVDVEHTDRSEFSGYYSRRVKRSMFPSRRRQAKRRAAAARMISETNTWQQSDSTVVDLVDDADPPNGQPNDSTKPPDDRSRRR